MGKKKSKKKTGAKKKKNQPRGGDALQVDEASPAAGQIDDASTPAAGPVTLPPAIPNNPFGEFPPEPSSLKEEPLSRKCRPIRLLGLLLAMELDGFDVCPASNCGRKLSESQDVRCQECAVLDEAVNAVYGRRMPVSFGGYCSLECRLSDRGRHAELCRVTKMLLETRRFLIRTEKNRATQKRKRLDQIAELNKSMLDLIAPNADQGPSMKAAAVEPADRVHVVAMADIWEDCFLQMGSITHDEWAVLANTVGFFVQSNGFHRLAEVCFRSVLHELTADGKWGRKALLIWLNLASILDDLGDMERARGIYQWLSTRSKDLDGAACYTASLFFGRVKEFERAWELAETAREKHKSADDTAGELLVRSQLANLMFEKGEVLQAERELTLLLDVVESIPSTKISVLHALSRTCRRLGKHEEALRYAEEELKLEMMTKNYVDIAKTQLTLGALHSEMGDRSSAKQLWEEATRVFRQYEQWADLIVVLKDLGLDAWRDGEEARARALCGEALALCRDKVYGDDAHHTAHAWYALDLQNDAFPSDLDQFQKTASHYVLLQVETLREMEEGGWSEFALLLAAKQHVDFILDVAAAYLRAGKIVDAFEWLHDTYLHCFPEDVFTHLSFAALTQSWLKTGQDCANLIDSLAPPRQLHVFGRWRAGVLSGARLFLPSSELALASRLLGDEECEEHLLTCTRRAQQERQLLGEDVQLDLHRLRADAVKILRRVADELAAGTRMISADTTVAVSCLFVSAMHCLDKMWAGFNKDIKGEFYFPVEHTQAAFDKTLSAIRLGQGPFQIGPPLPAGKQELKGKLLESKLVRLDKKRMVRSIVEIPLETDLPHDIQEKLKQCSAAEGFTIPDRAELSATAAKKLRKQVEKQLLQANLLERRNGVLYAEGEVAPTQPALRELLRTVWPPGFTPQGAFFNNVEKSFQPVKLRACASDVVCVVRKHQPFALFQEGEDPSSKSWLYVVRTVADESKHLQLTSTVSVSDLQQCTTGFVELCHAEVSVEYSEAALQLTQWSFFHLLASIPDIEQRRDASRQLIRFLKAEHGDDHHRYFRQEKIKGNDCYVVDSKWAPIRDHLRAMQQGATIQSTEQQLRAHIRQDAGRFGQPEVVAHSTQIGDYFVLQLNRFAQKCFVPPQGKVCLFRLVHDMLGGVTEIAHALAAAHRLEDTTRTSAAQEAEDEAQDAADEAAEQVERELHDLCTPQDRGQSHHRFADSPGNAAITLDRRLPPLNAAKEYQKLAHFSQVHGVYWLAMRYWSRAEKSYRSMHGVGHVARRVGALLNAAAAARQEGLQMSSLAFTTIAGRLADRTSDRELQRHGGLSMEKVNQQIRSAVSKRTSVMPHIDADLREQILFCQESLARIRWRLLRLLTEYEQSDKSARTMRFHADIVHSVTQLLVLVRNCAEQGLTRFVRERLCAPRRRWFLQMPLQISVASFLNKVKTESVALYADAADANPFDGFGESEFAENFPAVHTALANLCDVAKTLIPITNKSKHVKLPRERDLGAVFSRAPRLIETEFRPDMFDELLGVPPDFPLGKGVNNTDVRLISLAARAVEDVRNLLDASFNPHREHEAIGYDEDLSEHDSGNLSDPDAAVPASGGVQYCPDAAVPASASKDEA